MRITVTADYPEHEVRDLLTFAAKQVGLDHSHLTVKVKNSKTAYWRGHAWGRRKLVTIGLGPETLFPVQHSHLRRPFMVENWKEALVIVAAHEFTHIKDWNDIQHMSEKTANAHGFLAWVNYRKEKDEVHSDSQR